MNVPGVGSEWLKALEAIGVKRAGGWVKERDLRVKDGLSSGTGGEVIECFEREEQDFLGNAKFDGEC